MIIVLTLEISFRSHWEFFFTSHKYIYFILTYAHLPVGDSTMSNNIVLRYHNNYKSVCLDNLDTPQINNVVAYVARQVNKIYHRILYSSHPIPLRAMARLYKRLAMLHGMLDNITNLVACKQ